MSRDRLRPHTRFSGLSCYTANLASYLDAELPDVEAHIADSVRLAVRPGDDGSGSLAFSHHRYPLDRMPDGSLLRYATLPPRAGLIAVADELSRYGRVLVVTDGARLPWSPSRHRGSSAPHWLLVTGRRDHSWHVVDAFAGLLPSGEQRSYVGWLSTAQLIDAMTLPDTWTAPQATRNEFAFGSAVPVPDAPGLVWLRRDAEGAPASDLDEAWLVGDRQAIPFLSEYFSAGSDAAVAYLDDLWTAAQHRVFRYRMLIGRRRTPSAVRERYLAAQTAWEKLPSAIRFTVESALRGRPRPSLARQTFDNLIALDDADAELPALS